ncbi:MAG: RibD family protein [Methylocystis sp.]
MARLDQSLDGRIATVGGESRGISGPEALHHLHRLRVHVDAVVVGAGTIVSDDPRLNVRRIEGRDPARVVIDPNGRLDRRGKWLTEDGARRLLITAAPGAGVERIELPSRNGRIAPKAIVAALFALGLRQLLIEGGARTLAGLLEAGCVDRLHVPVSPVIIDSGRSGFELPPAPARGSVFPGRRRRVVRLRFFRRWRTLGMKEADISDREGADAVQNYSAPAKWLRWLVAPILLALIPVGAIMGDLPRGSLQDRLFFPHECST